MFKPAALLIDTSHLAYRSFFALQSAPSDVIQENLLYGMLNSLRSLMYKFNVLQLFLVWDRGYTTKTALYSGYKKKTSVMTKEQQVQMG